MTRQHMDLLIGWLLAVVAAAVMLGLGNWQLDRRAYKQALLQAHSQALQSPPHSLAAGLASAAPVSAVADCGQWDGPVLVLDNQQHNGRAGHRSFQPWRSEQGAWVLVELGWRVWDGQRQLPVAQAQQGRQCLRGVVVPVPSAGLRAGQGAAQALPGGGWLLTRLDPDSLQPLLGAQASAFNGQMLRPHASLAPGHVLPEQLLPNTLTPDKHLGYAVQWFALATSVLLLALILSVRHLRGRTGHLTVKERRDDG